MRKPGHFVGEVACFAGTPQTMTTEGRTDALLLRIPAETLHDLAAFPFPFATWFLTELARHATQWPASAQMTNQFGELQTYPYCNSSTFPGPYQAVQCELVYLFCKRAGQEMELATPPRVSWLGDSYMICAAHYPDFHSVHALEYVQMKYSEVSVMVPALVEGQELPKILIPFVYADSVQPVLAGREVYGYPKMKYPVAFDSDVGVLESDRFLVRKDGQNVIRATYETIEWASVDPEVRAAALGRWLDPYQQRQPEQEAIVDAGESAEDASWIIELFNALPEALRTLGVSTWKRDFSPSAYPSGPGPIPWKKEQFQVDGVAGSSFVMSNLSQIDFVVPVDLTTTDGFIDSPVDLELPVGLRVVLDLQMVPATMQQDYPANPPTTPVDLRKMMWGPRAWAHIFGVPEGPPASAPVSGPGASPASPEPSPSPPRDSSEAQGS
ncbi:MAG: hypothetical protein GY913_19435 [Proteobacteria bacterium]|nr:hypothetical protein [Pseudomonadota bacterium]